MAIKIDTHLDFEGRVDPADADYPWGKYKEKVGDVPRTGTPFKASGMNDLVGFGASILNEVGVVPNGTPDSVNNTQYLDALKDINAAMLTGGTHTGVVVTYSGQSVALATSTIAHTNTAVMVADTTLSEGQLVLCSGYGVQGSSSYNIKTAAQASIDGDVIDEVYLGFTLANTNVAILREDRRALAINAGLVAVGDNSPVLLSANKVTGNSVEVPAGDWPLSTGLEYSRYSALLGIDDQPWPLAKLKWEGATGENIITSQPNQTMRNITVDGGSTAGVVGLELGKDTTYTAYHRLYQDWIKSCDVGVRVSNVFDANLTQVRISNNRIGVKVDPVSFGSDGGYTTTFRIKESYITDNDEHGVIDLAPIQNKMFTIQDSVIEKNGNPTTPQIEMLGGGQVNYLTGLYVEDGSSTIPAIKINKGVLRDCYINGYSAGVDLGGGGSVVSLENVKFATANGSATSVTSSGGANAAYCGMYMCEFDGTPTLDSRVQVFTGCSGDMPTGLLPYGMYVSGVSPKFGVGSTPATTRDIEAWLHTDVGATIPANSVRRFNITISASRMGEGTTALSITPQSDLPEGLSATVARVSLTSARVTVTNPTALPITLPQTDYILRMENFSAINS